ncbi:MAG: hypothetical protein GKR89_19355 [Candidatus Latescibacteria bacterium]|nr:hypothetical protein [Candidatus Latescibacterota bacterium]
MHFLNPIVLVGLVAAAIPLAIHLLHRGRTQPQPFSNLEFLQRLHHNRMRRVQLRQWLILALRTLIILLLVLAFARPGLQAGQPGWGGGSAPTAAALLLDRSYSTAYRLPEGSIFNQLQGHLLELLPLFEARDEILLIPFAEDVQSVQATLGDDLAQRVRELQAGQEATDLGRAFAAAARFLADKDRFHRELYLFTDLTPHNWALLDSLPGGLDNVRIYISAPLSTPRENIHIDAVRLPSWMPAAGKKLGVEIELTNSSARPVTAVGLDLHVDDERVQHQSVDLDAGQQIQVEFALRPRRVGRLTGFVEVEDDLLGLDNRRYFALDVPERIQAVVLGHRPDDTYYPRRVFGAAAQADPVLDIKTGLIDDLDEELLRQADILLLCNLRRLSTQQIALVHGFVEKGGGLVVFPAPQADLNFYNRRFLPGLAPVLIRAAVGDSRDRDSYQSLDAAGFDRPLLAGLWPGDQADRPRFYSTFSLLPQAGLQPLLQFATGPLALVEAWKDKGRVLLFAAPLDLAWTDWPIRGSFAPLLHRLTRYLGLPPGHELTFRVGQDVHRRLGEVTVESNIVAVAPGERQMRLSPELIDSRYLWKIPQVDEAGLWQLRQDGQTVDRFPVNLDTRESVPQPLDPANIGRFLGADRTHFLEPGQAWRPVVLGNRYGRELWRECLLAALGLLLVELWVARRTRGRVESSQQAA